MKLYLATAVPTGLAHTVKWAYLHLASCPTWPVELFHGLLRSNPVFALSTSDSEYIAEALDTQEAI